MNEKNSICLHCREPIVQGARRCPACLSWQTRWAADSQNPRLELGLVVVLATVLALVVGAWAMRGSGNGVNGNSDAGYDQLIVKDVELWPRVEESYTSLTVVGVVENPTETAFTNVFFYVKFFDAEGHVIDSVSPRDYAIVVPAGGSARFKVVDRWLIHQLEDYVSVEAELTWAKELS